MCSPKVNLTYLRFTEDTNICDNTVKNKLKNEVKAFLKLLLNDKDKSNASTVIKDYSLYEVPLKKNGLKLKTSNNSKVIELNTDPKYFNTDCNCKLSLNKSIPFDFTNSVIRENGLEVRDNQLMINYKFDSQYLPLTYSASKNLEFKTECPLKVNNNKKLTLNYDHSDFKLDQGQLTLNQPYLHKNNNTYTFTTDLNNNIGFPMGGINMGHSSTLNFHNNSRIIIDNTYVNTNGNCIPDNPKGDYNYYISIDKNGHPSFKSFPESDINDLTYMKEKYDTLLTDYKNLMTTYETLEKEIMKYLPADGSNNADMTSIIGTKIVYPNDCKPQDKTKDQSSSDKPIPTEPPCDTSHCDPSPGPCSDVCDPQTCGDDSGDICGTGGSNTTTTTTSSPGTNSLLRIPLIPQQQGYQSQLTQQEGYQSQQPQQQRYQSQQPQQQRYQPQQPQQQGYQSQQPQQQGYQSQLTQQQGTGGSRGYGNNDIKMPKPGDGLGGSGGSGVYGNNNNDIKMPKTGDGSGEYKNTDKNQQTQGGGYPNLKFDFGDDNFFFINDDE